MAEKTYQQIVADRMKAEITAFEADRQRKGQLDLDFWMEQKLLDRAAAGRGGPPNVVSEYNPFAPWRMRS